MTEPAAPLVALDQVRAAHDRIRHQVVRTPLVPMSGSGVVLKAESLQSSGSFKLRGAFNSVLLLDSEACSRGVVAHSSGNHAVAVARAGAALGVRTVVVMPLDAPTVKVELTGAAGAEVDLVGPASAERAARAAELAHAYGSTLIEPFDSDAVIAATGTISVELFEDLHRETGESLEIYVPISGGGLASGASTRRRTSRCSTGVHR